MLTYWNFYKYTLNKKKYMYKYILYTYIKIICNEPVIYNET